MLFIALKTLIAKGSYIHEQMLSNLDLFLVGNRITQAQYIELTSMMDAQQQPVTVE